MKTNRDKLNDVSAQVCRRMIAGMMPLVKTATYVPAPDAKLYKPDHSLFDTAAAYGCMDAPEELPAGGWKRTVYGDMASARNEQMVQREQVQA